MMGVVGNRRTADMVTSGATAKGALAQLVSNNPSAPVQRAYMERCLDRVASITAEIDIVGLILG